MLGAAATAVTIGALGAYLVLCLIFYQNQAMLIFHPARKITATPANANLPYTSVWFDRNPEGQPQINGWWVPAAKNAPLRQDTILFLHGRSGSLSNTVTQIQALHYLGINVFAIDYQGFGNSAQVRPTEQLADNDTVAAWKYLTIKKVIRPSHVLLVGQGAGAVLAVHLAARHTVAGLVLAEISPTAHEIFEQDARARLLPLFLLAREHINPNPELTHLKTPKLFLSWPGRSAVAQTVTRQDYKSAATPKQFTPLAGAAPKTIAVAVQPFLRQILRADR